MICPLSSYSWLIQCQVVCLNYYALHCFAVMGRGGCVFFTQQTYWKNFVLETCSHHSLLPPGNSLQIWSTMTSYSVAKDACFFILFFCGFLPPSGCCRTGHIRPHTHQDHGPCTTSTKEVSGRDAICMLMVSNQVIWLGTSRKCCGSNFAICS